MLSERDPNLNQESMALQPDQKSITIPEKFQGLPSDLVEELWSEKFYVDNDKTIQEQNKRSEAISQIRANEEKRENKKTKELAEQYQNLSKTEKSQFSACQEQVKQIIANFFQDNEILILLPEEEFVLEKMKKIYNDEKTLNPSQPVAFKFTKEIDQKIFNNLINRLTFQRMKESETETMQARQEEKINTVREAIGINAESLDNKYSKFKVKNGETDTGVWWYEYGNQASKELRESGKFEWGKERIYFDISFKDMEKMKELALKVAKTNKIAIAFKYLDQEKTHQVNLKPESQTTRFVCNFASVEDAKKFYTLLSQESDYSSLIPDQSIDFAGYNIDGIAHYASGYRETRDALTDIIKSAHLNPDGTYTYTAMIPQRDGTKKPKSAVISADSYQKFKQQYLALPNLQEKWQQVK